jgi:hypothetical protein
VRQTASSGRCRVRGYAEGATNLMGGAIPRLIRGNAEEVSDGCSESGALCRRAKAHGRTLKLWKRSQAPRRVKTLRARR